MQSNFQICPCCNSTPKYRDVIANLVDYISKEAQLILSEHTLDKVIMDSKMEDLFNNKDTNFFNLFMDAGKTIKEANELGDKYLILQGRMNTLTDILKKIENSLNE